MMTRQLSEEHKQKISKAVEGMRNSQWMGDSVGYSSLHQWVRRHLIDSMPRLCQLCNEKEPYDLANTTGTYNRDYLNWAWYCRSCHMITDNRIYNLRNQ